MLNNFASLAYVNPQKATLTEQQMLNENQLNCMSHRSSNSRFSKNSVELQRSLVKKTKKKQVQRILDDDEKPKSAQPKTAQSVPQTNKKKLGFFPNKNQIKHEAKGAQSVDKVKEIKKNEILSNKQRDQIVSSRNINGLNRNSFQSQSSFSSFQSNSTNKSNSYQGISRKNTKSNSSDRFETKLNQIQEKSQKNKFGSTLSSVRTNGKMNAQQINPEEKKLQEDKKKYDLQLKLIRVKNQEFAKKCKFKQVDWKKVQKAQAKQKITEKVQICNEGMRVQQNMQKAIDDFDQEQSVILVEYQKVSDEMQARFKFFEEMVAPYEEKMSNDIHTRNQLLIKTNEQEKQLEYQKQINSNVQEDNSSLKLQNLLLLEQIAALKSKKQALIDQQVEIDNENKQLKENADIKQQHLNLLQKHYDEQASRSLWLKKEINLKKKGIFNINIISEKKNKNKMEVLEDQQENKILKEVDLNIGSKYVSNSQKEEIFFKEDNSNQDINYHYTCQINYLESNSFELLRSITDFEYFTPNQVYGIFYSDDSYQQVHSFLLQFMTFFTCSKIKSCNLVIYNCEGMSTFQTISEDTSFENIINSIKNISRDEQFLSPSSQNLGFTLHIDILNQQFYLGKQFNIVIACVNQSTSSQIIQNQLITLFRNKKLSSSENLSNNNSLIINNQTNMNNQLSCLIEKMQKKQNLESAQQQNSQKENFDKEACNMMNTNGQPNEIANENISIQQAQQNQQIQSLKRVKYNEISPLINKNVKNINFNQGTPKQQKSKAVANQTSQNRSSTKNNTGMRSYSEDRSSVKKKQDKLKENLNKTIVNQNQQKQENKYIVSYINEFFKKPNRLFTIHFNDQYQFKN